MVKTQPPHKVYKKGRLRIDFDACEICVDGLPVPFRRREFQLLRFFVEWANRVINRTQIIEHVWPRTQVKAQTVDVHVCRLRRYLERDPLHPEVLVTVRGMGWKFNERAL